MTEEPAKRWFQATGIPFASSPAEIRSKQYGPVHVVLDVFLAGPDDLDRTVDLLARSGPRERRRRPRAAGRSRRRADDCGRRPCRAAARHLRGGGLRSARSPGCRPRPRSRPCGREPCSSSAPSSRARGTAPGRSPRPWWRRRPSRLSASPMFCATAPGPSVAFSSSAAMAAVVSLRVRAVVPFDDQRREPFLRRPHVVGDDRDGVVEPHDLAHALDGLAPQCRRRSSGGRRRPATARASRSSRPAAGRRCRRRPFR